MSLFFALITTALWLFSHWWARCTRFSSQNSANVDKIFEGTREQFEKELQKTIKENFKLTIVEKSTSHLIVNEAPGIFSYGAFHHIEWKECEEGISIRFTIQPKLVISAPDADAKTKILAPRIPLKNAG